MPGAPRARLRVRFLLGVVKVHRFVIYVLSAPDDHADRIIDRGVDELQSLTLILST